MTLAALNQSRPAGYVIWLLIFISHITALGLFTRGFLLTRQVLPNLAENPNKEEFQRAVILIVDALRHDFIVEQADYNGEHYLNKMPLQSIGGSIFEFMADPPTTTLQRLKGLTTGSLPTFVDAGSNFAGTEINEDNWLLQASAAGKPIAFVGDDTWDALYGHIFSQKYPYPSLNVRDLDTVDNGVKSIMPSLIANTSNSIVIGHMLGVDHVGHRFGPNHPAMAEKMTETFEFIKEVAASIDDNTVLFVMGDHGMDQTGNHGGDSYPELSAGLWAYAKKRNFPQGKTVQQIDFVPTISGLLGLPVPFNNLGFPILELTRFPDLLAISSAEQLSTYAEVFGHAVWNKELETPIEYQQKTLALFRETWATFNMSRIYRGLGLLALSLYGLFSLYQTLTPQNLTLKARRMVYGAGVGIVASTVVVWFTTDANFINVALDILTGLAAGAFVAPITLPRPGLPGWRTALAIALLVLHCLCLLSNSYTIYESQIVLFFSVTIVLLLLFKCIGLGAVEQYIGVPSALLVLAILRISSSLYVCREEHGENCSSTFYEVEGTSSTGHWALACLSALIIAWPLLIRLSYTIGQNMTGTASLCLQAGVPLTMMIITGYWSLDAAETRGYISEGMFGTFKVVLSRIVLGLSFFAGPYMWAKGDPCVAIDLQGDKPRILGYQNIFGAYAYLPMIFISWSVLISSKPPAILCVCGLVVSLFQLSDLLDLSYSKQSLLAQVTFLLLGFLAFFTTGHQMTLVSIQWDSAFVSSKVLSYPVSAITVALNTFGPFVIVAMAAVLISVWRRAQHTDARIIYTLLTRAMLATCGIAAVQAFTSMIAATVLRRHLMAWKIFAPRYIYGGIILLFIDIGALLGLAFGDHAIKKVTELFGG